MTLTAPGRRLERTLAEASLAATALFAGAVVALHAARPDLDPSRRLLSEYALGPSGGVMTAALIVGGLGVIALALAARGLPLPRAWSLLLTASLGLAGTGLVAAGLFTTDASLEGSPVTFSGRIHSLAVDIGMTSIVAAAALFPFAVRGEPRWRPLRYPLIVLGGLTAGLWLGLPVIEAATNGLFGIGQRLFLAFAIAWMLIVALWIAAEGPPAASDGFSSRGPVRAAPGPEREDIEWQVKPPSETRD